MSTDGLTESQIDVRESVGKICEEFPDEFWMEKDLKGEYAGELHAKLAEAGYIGICMPTELGGVGLGISEATVMLQTIAESGAGIAGAQTIHANVYATMPLLKFATDEQRARYLPPIIDGSHKVCFGVTEPNSGLDTLKLQTRAERKGDKYIINGSKIWITNAQRATKMVLLARTTPLGEGKPSEGLSIFFADLKEGREKGTVQVSPIKKMGGKAVDANAVFFDNFEVDAADLIGTEGAGFKQILHGMNAERCLLAGEALGLGYAALRRAAQYTSERVIFGKPVAANQAIQHPLADSWCNLEAAKMMTYFAARRYDEGQSSGEHANAAKYLAAEAAFTACERAITSHGGMGYSAEYHVERYLREVLVPRIGASQDFLTISFTSDFLPKPLYRRK
ncbi:acyl-CoA dehydrogenase NM domain-like protein [Pseudohyphozyma bogoriensis]|nr:acyl-CoA dehydrogenase NM domain-like protein [Pseudohyphozyma bogoriensis]